MIELECRIERRLEEARTEGRRIVAAAREQARRDEEALEEEIAEHVRTRQEDRRREQERALDDLDSEAWSEIAALERFDEASLETLVDLVLRRLLEERETPTA